VQRIKDKPMKESEVMIGIKEMAALRGIGLSTMYREIEKGRCPWNLYQVTPTKKVARKADVLKWLDEYVKIPAASRIY